MWRKLDKLWKGTNNRIKDKLNIYNAVVRSKVAYSLETAPLSTSHKKKLDAFQQKGIRQIMGIQPTFIDISMSNEKVLELANAEMNEISVEEYKEKKRQEGENHVPKIERLSKYIANRAIAHIGHICRAEKKDPIRQVIWTHAEGDATLNIPDKFRVGRPRMCWIRTHLEIIWERFKHLSGENGKFNFRKKLHLNILEDFAKERLF